MLYPIHKLLIICLSFFVVSICQAGSTKQLTDDDVAQILIQQSIASYSVPAMCPKQKVKILLIKWLFSPKQTFRKVTGIDFQIVKNILIPAVTNTAPNSFKMIGFFNRLLPISAPK